MKKNNKKYTAPDFAHYHSGTMPAKEMHALEKAALEDPFLADALEGYAYSKSPKEELEEINRRIEEKRKRRKVFNIFSLSTAAWWRVAALFVVFAGAGYLFFLTNNISNEASLAVKEVQITKEKDNLISRIKEDTISTSGSLAFEKPLHPPTPTRPVKPIPPSVKQEQTSSIAMASKDKKTNAPNAGLLRFEPKNKRQVPTAILNDQKRPESTLNNKVVGQSALAAPKSAFMIKKRTLAKDIQRNVQMPESTAIISPVEVGYINDSTAAVGLYKNRSPLQEVVVTGIRLKHSKKKSNNIKTLQRKASNVEIKTSTAYLLEGKEKFDLYIKNHATRMTDSASVLLSFTLDSNSNPATIKVLQSSCKACEKEAIQLLKDGPKWVGNPGAHGSIRIKF